MFLVYILVMLWVMGLTAAFALGIIALVYALWSMD